MDVLRFLRGSTMAFMMVLLVALLGVTVWAYFHTDPDGVARRPLALYNAAVMLAAAPAAFVVGRWLYAEAAVVKAGQAGMAVYLSVMAGGTVFLIVVALGGMVRNFFVFPANRRVPTGERA